MWSMRYAFESKDHLISQEACTEVLVPPCSMFSVPFAVRCPDFARSLRRGWFECVWEKGSAAASTVGARRNLARWRVAAEGRDEEGVCRIIGGDESE